MTDDKHAQQLQHLRDAVDRKAEQSRADAEEHSRIAADRPPDAQDPRAKSTGHKKKTADKWNQ